ncbi:MAG: hypothetical protein JWM98_2275, partial [Thermoleophilia bacterium]|nr:hypothetical protein [Thermoleophilia bacterium]
AAMFSKTVTITIKAKSTDRISWISMLGCTNDGFAGFNAARLPQGKNRTVFPVVGDYDAGTEENTEDFVDLTPTCQAAIGVKSQFGATGATATNWQLAEGGVVARHAGVNGVSDDGLTEATHGWDPRKVAKVSITRID